MCCAQCWGKWEENGPHWELELESEGAHGSHPGLYTLVLLVLVTDALKVSLVFGTRSHSGPKE